MKISFIGAGSMAEAIIAGLVEKKIYNNEDIFATNHSNKVRLTELEQKYGICTTYEMEHLVCDADIVILAVKPKDVGETLEKIKPFLNENALLISVIAGISIEFIAKKLGLEYAVTRAMPNTSASIGKSATAIVYNRYVTNKQKELAATIFSAIGITTVVEEIQLDAITGLSGSGPAYIYYIVEAMEKAARENGLDEEIAKPFIIQTLLGAAEMLQSSGKKATELRSAVTSAGGTTEAGINVLKQLNVEEAFIQCIKAAAEQSEKLRTLYETKITT